MGRGARTSERAHVGSFWCSRRGREREEVREHQNEPMWARSGGQDGEGCPNIRTSLCGLVLVFEMKERERGGVQDEGEGEERCVSTRTSPCGHVLVVETGRGARTSERARVGSF